MKIKGNTILITGGATGIGFALAGRNFSRVLAVSIPGPDVIGADQVLLCHHEKLFGLDGHFCIFVTAFSGVTRE